MKSKKKIADRTRHSQNCNFYADVRFCKRGSEAKNARGCSHRLFLEEARSGHIAKRTSNGATRANENYKNGSDKRRLGVKKVRFLIEDVRNRFSEMCFPPRAGSTFLQNNDKKHDVMQRCMQNAFCNLHFRCKFASRSDRHKFFAFRSASAERNENHKNRSAIVLGGPGGMRGGAGGDMRGSEICKFEFEDMDFCFGFDTPCLGFRPRAADSIALRIPPGRDKGSGKREDGKGNKEEGRPIHDNKRRTISNYKSQMHQKSK